MEPEAKLDCKHCNQKFESKNQLAKHQYLHREEHYCKQCSKPFASESGLKRHINANHSNKGMLTCHICQKVFKLKRDLEKHHLQLHRADKHFQCKYCGVKFSWMTNLKKHESFHKSENADVLEKQMENGKDANPVVKLFQCEICGKKFNFDFTYAIHLQGHEKAKESEECNKSVETQPEPFEIVLEISKGDSNDTSFFSDAGENLKNDSKTDTDEKSTILQNYIPTDSENNNLFQYLKECKTRREEKIKRKRNEMPIYDCVMTDKKPFECEVCGEQFRWEVSFEIHKKVHSEGRTIKIRKPYEKFKKQKNNSNINGEKNQENEDNDSLNTSTSGTYNNTSKILYQNESDEDNDIYEDFEQNPNENKKT